MATHRRRLEEALQSGELKVMSHAELAARVNGGVHVDVKSRELPDFTQQVNAGAALLDEKMPGWWRHIDTSALDLNDENYCVLGQSWGHYVQGQGLANAIVSREHAGGFGSGTRGVETNFRRFLRRLFQTSDSSAGAAYGFAFSGAVYSWANVEAERREREDGKSHVIINGRSYHRSWEVDKELWEHLTLTWLVLIKARQEHGEAQRAQLVEDVSKMSAEELADELLRLGYSPS